MSGAANLICLSAIFDGRDALRQRMPASSDTYRDSGVDPDQWSGSRQSELDVTKIDVELPTNRSLSGSAPRELRVVRLDHAASIVFEMVSEVVERSCGGQFLADLRDRLILRVASRTADADERSITCVEMNHHVAVVLVLAGFEAELPVVREQIVHDLTVDEAGPRAQGRRSSRCGYDAAATSQAVTVTTKTSMIASAVTVERSSASSVVDSGSASRAGRRRKWL